MLNKSYKIMSSLCALLALFYSANNSAYPGGVGGSVSQQLKNGSRIAITVPKLPFGRGAPIKGRDGKSMIPKNKLKLNLIGIKVNNQDAVSHGVSIGDMTTTALNVHNLSNKTKRVRVGYMVGNRVMFTSVGSYIDVPPGRTTPVLVNVRINSTNSDRNIHRLGGTEGLWWTPVFTLLTTRNNPYRDSNMADNTVGKLNPVNILVKPKNDLAVVGIENVTLTETWHGGGTLDEGTMHPVSLTAIIKVKNNGSQTSRQITMTVNLMSSREAVTSARRDRGASYDRVGSCAYWPRCSMSKDYTIVAISAGQTRSFPVSFAPIPHSIERSKHHRTKVAAGPYACGSGPEAMPSSAKVSVMLRTTDEDAAFMQNNSLTKEGKFRTASKGRDTVTCRF